MKKFLTMMTAAAVLLCGIVFAGCGVVETVKETVSSSYDQWYIYKKGDKQIDIPLVDSEAYDTDEANESTTKLKDADIYFIYNPDSGLTVAIQAVTTQNVSVLNGLVTNTMDMVVGQEKQYPDFGKGKWGALWGSGKIKKADAPKIHTNPEQCIDLDSENGPKIQWKKFMANYLLDKLLED